MARRSGSGWGYGNYGYESAAEKKEKALKQLDKLRKKNPDIKPVTVKGNKLARTWWGQAWNTNLERYSDYENRLGRGRSYVRHGCILDLQINPGMVLATVQGSRAKPYEINIDIRPLSASTWDNLVKACEGKIDSLTELLEGKFPKPLGELFLAKGGGLFPSPAEIRLSCSCPDYAVMCKHVAAALYGVGARLDEEPSMLFTLRNVNVGELITKAIDRKSEELLGKCGSSRRRIIAGGDIGGIFGIELDQKGDESTSSVIPVPTAGTGKRGRPRKTAVSEKAAIPAQTAAKKRGRPRKG